MLNSNEHIVKPELDLLNLVEERRNASPRLYGYGPRPQHFSSSYLNSLFLIMCLKIDLNH